MIRIDEGTIEMGGSVADLVADTDIAIMETTKVLADRVGTKQATELMLSVCARAIVEGTSKGV